MALQTQYKKSVDHTVPHIVQIKDVPLCAELKLEAITCLSFEKHMLHVFQTEINTIK